MSPELRSPTERAVVRVYVPMTLTAAASALRAGTVPAGAVHAVTPALRERYGTDELEELELAALTDAAQVSVSLLAAERAARRGGEPVGALSSRALRVVLAADAAVEALPPADAASPSDGPASPSGDEEAPRERSPGDLEVGTAPLEHPVPGRPTRCSVVRLAGDVPWSAVASAHVDEPDAEPDVAAAVEALLGLRAAPSDREGEALGVLEALEDAEACDLLWYATSELPGLLEDLSTA